MRETNVRVKRGWLVATYTLLVLGVLALIPLLLGGLHVKWLWWVIGAVVLWIAGGVVYLVGRSATARPMMRPPLR